MTPEAEAAAIIGGDLRFGSWANDPAAVLGAIVGRAADARARQDAAHLTHLACALVAALNSPYVERGAVLDSLVIQFGAGLP